MKTLILALLTAVSASAFTVADHLGLQMYSLRVVNRDKGWAAALDRAKELGFTFIEGGLPKTVTTEAYKTEIAARGLNLVGCGFSYERLTKDAPGAVAEAKGLGVHYVMVAWIPHKDSEPFTDESARSAAADFNTWGALFKVAGITLVYHPHGYEFRPNPDGSTPFDVLVKAANPDDLNFELDVFWAKHAGQDPVKLMARYPDRWRLMHVKDIRKGAQTGLFTGRAPSSDDVSVGSGQVDWPAVLKEARAVGIQWYFIEDESDTPDVNIPRSIAYLKALGQ